MDNKDFPNEQRREDGCGSHLLAVDTVHLILVLEVHILPLDSFSKGGGQQYLAYLS